jgi:translation initiation factor 1A
VSVEYAQVTKMLGNGRLEAQCFDGEKRLAHIRGKLRKKVWINQGDIILLSLREFQDAKADVILKYTADEARNLKAYGELPETAKINETDTFPADGDEEISFDFDIEDVPPPFQRFLWLTDFIDLIMRCVSLAALVHIHYTEVHSTILDIIHALSTMFMLFEPEIFVSLSR